MSEKPILFSATRTRDEWMREARDGRYHPFQASLSASGCRWCRHDRRHPIHDQKSDERRLSCPLDPCMGVSLTTWEVEAHMASEHGVRLCGLDHWKLTQRDLGQIARLFRRVEP